MIFAAAFLPPEGTSIVVSSPWLLEQIAWRRRSPLAPPAIHGRHNGAANPKSGLFCRDPNNPDGGFFERLVGFYVPGIDVYLNGATPPNSPYPTTIYTNQYDMAANFPQYILNPVSDINAIFGFFFGAHSYTPTDLAAAIPLPTSPGYSGLTTYYWIPTQNLPLVTPLRWYIPAPFGNAIADLLTPDLRVLADLGYASGN
jgi:hypothetical protein